MALGRYEALVVGCSVGSNEIVGNAEGCPNGMALGNDEGVIVGCSVGSHETVGEIEG